ncbi:hypothetical protein [Novosphingobium sp. BL-52-GroH]|uniref:hypothetical protein n=1 Tax=Novosphingobium sp. BL-52-GroH TaxID=3349877 RepID=UPI00384DE28A
MKLPHLAASGLIVVLAGATLALGACKKAEEQPKAAAGGQLLPRSVGDDMLPYDTVRSQATLSDPDAGLYEGPVRAAAPDVAASAAAEDEVVSDAVTPEDVAPPPAQ